MMNLILIIFGGIVGFFFKDYMNYIERKQISYSELLPPIIKMGYDSKTADESQFNKALALLWLYGSEDVLRKMDKAVSLLHKKDKKDLTYAFQEAIVEMRYDIETRFLRKKIDPRLVNHIYTKIVK